MEKKKTFVIMTSTGMIIGQLGTQGVEKLRQGKTPLIVNNVLNLIPQGQNVHFQGALFGGGLIAEQYCYDIKWAHRASNQAEAAYRQAYKEIDAKQRLKDSGIVVPKMKMKKNTGKVTL